MRTLGKTCNITGKTVILWGVSGAPAAENYNFLPFIFEIWSKV